MTTAFGRLPRPDPRALRRRRLPEVVVAVVDSGIDATHPALAGRVREAWHLAGPSGTRPRRASARRDNDGFGHGTAVAGIVTRVAPNARLIDVRVLDERCLGTGAALLAGFALALDRGAEIVNLSLACVAEYAGALHDLCERAYRRNRIVVAAKRNMPLADGGFPAELSSCIGVDAGDLPSPYDVAFLDPPPVEFAARGEHVLAPAPGGRWTHVTGTSFATPAVTGLCALFRGAHPDLRLFEMKTLLKRLARRTRSA